MQAVHRAAAPPHRDASLVRQAQAGLIPFEPESNYAAALGST
jgi:hypothetical protein